MFQKYFNKLYVRCEINMRYKEKTKNQFLYQQSLYF